MPGSACMTGSKKLRLCMHISPALGALCFATAQTCPQQWHDSIILILRIQPARQSNRCKHVKNIPCSHLKAYHIHDMHAQFAIMQARFKTSDMTSGRRVFTQALLSSSALDTITLWELTRLLASLICPPVRHGMLCVRVTGA